MTSERRQDVVFRALARGVESADSRPTAVAVCALGALMAELDPLIGEGGVHALYARSLRLAAASFPWLAPSDTSGSSSALLADLEGSLGQRAEDDARAAGVALLTLLADLLATLTGDALTHRILLAARKSDGLGGCTSDSRR